MENNPVLAENESIEWQWNIIGIGFFLVTCILIGILLKKDFGENVFSGLLISTSMSLIFTCLTTFIGFNVIN